MPDFSLAEIISNTERKRHTLLSWVSDNFDKLYKGQYYEEADEYTKKLLDVNNNLEQLVRYLANVEEERTVNSHYVFIRVAQLYTFCLTRLGKAYPGKIYDASELLANVLAEEPIRLGTEKSANDKDKKKKSNPKKTYVFSPIKDLACTVLTQLFETFGNRISALGPLISGSVFKNVKKMLEKTKYIHATYMTSLLQLHAAILKNTKNMPSSNTYYGKFVKLSKIIIESIQLDQEDYPIDFLSSIIEIWSIYMKQDQFIKDHSTNLKASLCAKFSEREWGIFGLVNDHTRTCTARSIAEVLFHFFNIKKLVSLSQVWEIYAEIFCQNLPREIQAGCFESIIHFIGLCSGTDTNFFAGINYLELVMSLSSAIFCHPDNQNRSIETSSRYLRYFEHMHEILLPRVWDSSKSQILFRVMGCIEGQENGDSRTGANSKFAINGTLNNQWLTLVQLELVRRLLCVLSSSFGNEQHIVLQIKRRLVELSTCDTFIIRIHSVEVLKTFLKNFPEYLSETIESQLTELSNDFKLDERFPFSVNHGRSLLIANLIECADKDYVSYELIMRITIFATSFIKNHTTSTNSSIYYKGLICWILLIGLVNYKDEQYLTMQSSQLFLFWKVLLTHTFTHHDEDELYKNLEIRNHSLVCLLTYLSNITIQKDVAKQVSYLLTKCSNYNHSVTVKSNSIDKALLVNEYRLLQVYLRINEYIKKDFNSSLLILIVKNFSDPNLYCESVSPGLDSIKKAGTKKPSKDDTKEDAILHPCVNTLLCQNDGFAFGLSSKISSSAVTELTIKSSTAPDFEVGQNTISREYYWYQPFEDEIAKPILPVLCFDYLIMLYGSSGYSGKDRYGPRITTSLIDSSMELFSLVFPYLNAKIQYSVVESLNLSMFSKLTTPLRSVAIATNSAVSIHGALKIIQDKEMSLESSVGQLLMESVKKINFYDDPFLTYLKAECIGLITAAVSRGVFDKALPEYVTEQSNIIIKNVVDLNDPYLRVLNVLSLSAIFKYNSQKAKFHAMFDVIFTLLKDPHPVVHGWSLKSLDVILKKHQSMDLHLASDLFRTLEDIAMDPNFGTYGSSIIRYNYSKEFDSHILLGQIFCTLTETVGPSIPELDKTAKEAFRNVTFGCITTNDAASQSVGLAIYENIATFKLSGTLCDEVFIGLAMSVIGGSFITGFGASYFNPHYTGIDEIIPFTTSMKTTFDIFRLFTQMLRLQKGGMFLKNMDTQSWRYLTLYPHSPTIIGYFFAWLEQSYKKDIHWFEKLCAMFNMTRGKLFGGLFQKVKNILEEKGLHKVEEKQIRGEEEVSITNSSEETFKGVLPEGSESICWLAKISILRLILYLCEQVQLDEKLSHVISKEIPSLIRISFQASTTRVTLMKSMGLKILNILLKQHTSTNGNEDNLMIEQQEAQITSALMPAFSEGSSPSNVASAINVAAEFLGSNIAPMERMSRISQLLVTLLGTFNEKSSTIKVGETTIVTQRARRKIELAILNAWAWLVYSSLSAKNDDLFIFVKGYLDVVVPLWIISLREYVMVKYEGVKTEEELEMDPRECLVESQNTKLELYKPVWLNFVVALGSLMESEQSYICKCLDAEEMESFMFILFAQCMETTVKNIDDHSTKMKILPALHNILRNSLPINNLFEDDIHSEFVGILDRLMIMGDNNERILLIYIINDLVVGYTNQNRSHGSFLEGIDKLYELLRLLLMPVGTILPFIKATDTESESTSKIDVTNSSLSVLKLTFGVFESNVSQFDDLFKVDLYACLLFIMGKIYKSSVADSVIGTILPLLKSLTKSLIEDGEHVGMLDIFYGSIRDVLRVNINKQHRLATVLILLSNGYQRFDGETLEEFSVLLVDGIRKQETQAISVQGFKTIINLSQKYEPCSVVLKKTIRRLSLLLKEERSVIVHRLGLEILGYFGKKIVEEKPERAGPAITLVLLFILSSYDACPEIGEVAGDKVVSIIQLDFSTFKSTINKELNHEQKERIEMIVRQSSEYQGAERNSEGSDPLALRSFN